MGGLNRPSSGRKLRRLLAAPLVLVVGCSEDGGAAEIADGTEATGGKTTAASSTTDSEDVSGHASSAALTTSVATSAADSSDTAADVSSDDTGPRSSVDRAAAFPEACGYGAHPRDWSDAARVYVTNLDDAGPGSFRAAMTAQGKRIVVFRVAGTIELQSLILVQTPSSDVYVAGQTAPGDGIQIVGPTESGGHLIRFRGTANGTFDNAIIRFVSWRGQKVDAASGDVLAIQGSTNVVLDHNSLAFSSDEILGINALSCAFPEYGGGIQHDIGVTNNLVAEPFEPHTTAALFGTLPSYHDVAGCPAVTPYVIAGPTQPPFDAAMRWQGARNPWVSRETFGRLTLHRNVFSSATHRTPLLATVDTSYTNNIAYGVELAALQTQGAAEFDAVGNMTLVHAEVIQSPIYGHFLQQRMAFETGEGIDEGNRYALDNPNIFFDVPASIYMASAYYETSPYEGTIIDPWAATDGVPDYWEERVGSESNATSPPDIVEANWPCDGSDWRCNLNAERRAPLHRDDGSEDSEYACAIELAPGPDLVDAILDDVGNSRRIDCAGDWQPRRQPTDERQVFNVRNRTDSVGGARPIGTQGGTSYPQLRSISPTTIDDVGGYDVLTGGDPCADADDDGLPDAFEARWGLNTDVDDGMLDPDGDGYTNLEEWFNGTQPQ